MNGLIVGFTSSLPLLLIVGPIALMIVDTGPMAWRCSPNARCSPLGCVGVAALGVHTLVGVAA
mgnify:CR=1 FL=1